MIRLEKSINIVGTCGCHKLEALLAYIMWAVTNTPDDYVYCLVITFLDLAFKAYTWLPVVPDSTDFITTHQCFLSGVDCALSDAAGRNQRS